MSEARFADDGSDIAVAEHVARALRERDASVIVVPGGGTPKPILGQLAAMDLPWERARVFLTDDRDVPSEHPASNLGQLRRLLQGTGADIRPLDSTPPRADLTWIGMGSDGHVASLFPGMAEAKATDGPPAFLHVTPDPLPPEAPFARATLNLAALVNTRQIILVIRGAGKRAVLARALAGEADLPVARLLGAARCPVTIYEDAA